MVQIHDSAVLGLWVSLCDLVMPPSPHSPSNLPLRALYRGNGAEAHCLLLASVGHPFPMPAFTQPWVSQLVHQSRASPKWSYLPYNLPRPTGRARSWGQCSSVNGELLHLNADCLELGVSLMDGESPPTSTSPLSSQYSG